MNRINKDKATDFQIELCKEILGQKKKGLALDESNNDDNDGDHNNEKSLVPSCRMSQSHHEGGCASKKEKPSV